MPRIPAAELERLKTEVALERLVSARGTVLKPRGADLVGLCPFHADREPSLVVTPAKNLWHCFGCGAGGGVIDWVMKADGVSFRHAVALLQADAPPSAFAAGSGAVVKRATVRRLDAPVSRDADDQTLLNQVIDYYHATLKQSPEALAYLESRGIGSPEAIQTFQLGYADRTLGLRLPEKTRKAGAELRGRLVKLGVYRESGHEHFNGSLIVPLFDADGQVVEVYGRKRRDDLRPGTPKHLYLPGPHRGVWNRAALQTHAEIILCESLIDALTFWCAGYRNVTASYGVNGCTEELHAALTQPPIERVLIAYDRDEAGEQAATTLAAALMNAGIDVYRIHFPHGMDANDYALHAPPARESLGAAIRSAIWLGKGNTPQRAPVPGVITATVTQEAAQESAAQETDQEIAQEIATQERVELASLAAEPSSLPEPAPSPLPEPELFSPNRPWPAAVLPDVPPLTPAVDPNANEQILTFDDRRYRLRGLDRLSLHALKINLLVTRGDALHVDTFDLYAAKSRGLFIQQAALELGVADAVIKGDLSRVLLHCEAVQDVRLQAALEPKAPTVVLSEAERRDALAWLQAPDLLPRLLDDFERCGVVGEATNKLVGYLACISRHLDKPLAILIQSTSAAGKSALMDALLNLMPEEARVHYSALTGQSLFYLGETELKHKILAISEEEGARNAHYALKLLQSEGELTIASTGKDEATGHLVTRQYRVEGPVMLFLTTTAIDLDDELLNRCLVLTVDESRAQTQAIHARQRQQQTLDGLLRHKERQRIVQRHRNAQRLLRPLFVANPFAERLTFIDDKTRTRRDHLKYLTLIRAIALLHQHQRPIHTVRDHGQDLEYLDVTPADIATANRLAHEVLGRTLDELPPQTRRLLQHLKTMVQEGCRQHGLAQRDYRFSRRDIRDHTGWSDGQLKIHCTRLTDLEYLLIHRGGRGQSIVYELLYDGDLDHQKHLMGLIDPKTLSDDSEKSGPNASKTAPSQGQVSPKSGPSQGHETRHNHMQDKDLHDVSPASAENAIIWRDVPSPSYPQVVAEDTA